MRGFITQRTALVDVARRLIAFASARYLDARMQHTDIDADFAGGEFGDYAASLALHAFTLLDLVDTSGAAAAGGDGVVGGGGGGGGEQGGVGGGGGDSGGGGDDSAADAAVRRWRPSGAQLALFEYAFKVAFSEYANSIEMKIAVLRDSATAASPACSGGSGGGSSSGGGLARRNTAAAVAAAAVTAFGDHSDTVSRSQSSLNVSGTAARHFVFAAALDVMLWLAMRRWLPPTLPSVFAAERMDASTVADCEQLFDALESRMPHFAHLMTLESESSKRVLHYKLLALCTQLLHRLSKADHVRAPSHARLAHFAVHSGPVYSAI